MAAPMKYFKLGRSVIHLLGTNSTPESNVTQVAIKSLRYFNSNRNSITGIARSTYTRVYPTLLVQPDGSTIRMSYPVPQRIIKLPIDVTKLTDADRRTHVDKHKLRQKVVIEDEIQDEFSIEEYSHLWKKPPKTS